MNQKKDIIKHIRKEHFYFRIVSLNKPVMALLACK